MAKASRPFGMSSSTIALTRLGYDRMCQVRTEVLTQLRATHYMSGPARPTEPLLSTVGARPLGLFLPSHTAAMPAALRAGPSLRACICDAVGAVGASRCDSCPPPRPRQHPRRHTGGPRLPCVALVFSGPAKRFPASSPPRRRSICADRLGQYADCLA